MTHIDDPGRLGEIRSAILGKPALRRLYLESYAKYRECLARCPPGGIALEVGSGGGFARDVMPELVTSDVLAYRGVDVVVDATRMPFGTETVRAVLMLNVFHHIPDAAAFLAEAGRVLKPGGRLLILDEYPGWISTPILKYAHHEPFDAAAPNWAFRTTGPLSGANGALAWIVFVRDRARLEREFPRLRIAHIRPHTPLRYWLSGGLKRWSLLPGWAYPLATGLDRALCGLSGRFGSFVDIELVRV